MTASGDGRSTVIVVADPSRPAYEAAIREAFARPEWTVRVASGFDDAELVAWAQDADVLVTRRRPIPEAFLAAATRLRSVQHIGGVPRPEVAAWTAARGLPLELTPSLGNVAVAEQAVALLLAVMRRVVVGHAATVGGAYREVERAPKPTSEVEHGFQWMGLDGLRTLYGAVVGVVGLGDIGRAFATRVRSFGAEVRYHQRNRLSPRLEAELGVTYRSLDDMIAEVDVLSLHVPHTAETERLIDSERLASMQPRAIIINVSRGGLVDENALDAALRSGHLGGAGLDVFAFEPIPHDHALLTAPNVVLSPHVGAAPARGLGEAMVVIASRIQRGLTEEGRA